MAQVITEVPAEWKVRQTAPGTAPWDGWRQFSDGQLYMLDASDYEGKAPGQRAKAERWAVAAGYKLVEFARNADKIAIKFEKLSDEDAKAQRVAHAAALKALKEERAAKAAQTVQEAPPAPEGTPAPVDPFAASTAV